MKFIIAAIMMIAVASASNHTAPADYSCNCKSSCCTGVPSNGNYYLTSFCDQSTACGTSCGNCNWAYSTSAMRFGCNAQLQCCKGSTCTTLRVIDSGPACWVEENAGMPIIDASYSTCKLFTGSTSCGWSDRISIHCTKLSRTNMLPDFQLGPCALTSEDAKAKGIPLCPEPELDL